MEKIPTLFERDWDGDRSRVVNKLAVILPEGAIATRKWDGMAALVREGKLYRRYDLKVDRKAPEGFEPCGEADPKTGHCPGWVPIGDTSEDRYFREALMPFENETYELVGPKIQGNPDHYQGHMFVRHGAEVLSDVPTDFNGLFDFFGSHIIEGIVWWHEGKPVAKIKRRDFGWPWPAELA